MRTRTERWPIAALIVVLLLSACGTAPATTGPHQIVPVIPTRQATAGREGTPVAAATPATPATAAAAGTPAAEGRFISAAAMDTARAGHSATLLQNGQVLVVGGEPNHGTDARALNSAATYDPVADRWLPTPSLESGRTNHTAVLLKNGQVLVMGGETGRDSTSTVLNTTALYDPATNTWKAAAPMGTPRARFTANLLTDGTVFVLGGVTTDGKALNTAERYDPATNSWQPDGNVPNSLASHCTTTLADGRLLITGGEGSPDSAGQRPLLAAAGIYDALTKSWTPANDMSSARARHTARVLPGGRVMVTGGNMPTGPGQGVSAEFFDTKTATWQPARGITTDRYAHSASVLGDGTVLIVGGTGTTSGAPLDSAERYDPATNSWQGIQMGAARSRHSATPLGNGQVLIIGGEGSGTDNLQSVERYIPPATARPATPATATRAAGPPPGQREVILFSSHRGEVHDSQIYIMNVDGSGQKQLTATSGHAWGPRIAPDGKSFIFSAVVAGQPHTDHSASGGGLTGSGNHDIYRANVDGSNITKLVGDPSWDNGWSWSPDGKWITFTTDRDGNWEIYRMAPDGTQVTRLTNDPAQDGWPSWSADGQQLIFSSNRNGHPQIFAMKADGSNPHPLLTTATDDTFPFVSPDGKRIVFVSYRPGTNESEIYMMNIDGSGATRLTSTVALNVTPAWSPDGSKIVFSSNRDGSFNIYVMNADGSGLKRLTSDGDNETPSWGHIQVASAGPGQPTGNAPAGMPTALTPRWMAVRRRAAKVVHPASPRWILQGDFRATTPRIVAPHSQ